MTTKNTPAAAQQLANVTSRKVTGLADTLTAWMTRSLTFAIVGVRSPAVAEKIVLHLDRFIQFFVESDGHDRISTLLTRAVLAWQRALTKQGFAPATTNTHLASLSGFTTWVHAQSPRLFPGWRPRQGERRTGAPPLELRALTEAQADLATPSSAWACFCGGKKMTDLAGVPFCRQSLV